MKKLLTLVVLFFLIIPTTSYATIVYCNGGCFKLGEEHLTTVKGLLYEVAERQDKKTKITFSPHVADTIVWMEKIHKEDKIYKISEIKKDDRANLLNKSLDFIIDVIAGKTKFDPRVVMVRWTETGLKVVAQYKEKIVNKKIISEYVLGLKK